MIERKKKICKDCGTPQYIWAHGRCRMCDSRSKLTPGGLRRIPNKPFSPKRHGNIPNRTQKRKLQEALYYMIIKKMDKQKDIRCFFCDEPMKRPEIHHHLLGRDEDLLTDERYIVHAHDSCHKDYHDKSVHKLPWFMDYVNRVSDIDTELAEREMNKLNK